MIKDQYYFPVILDHDEDFIGFTFPDFPKHNTYHRFPKEEEALAEAKNSLGRYLYWIEKNEATIPAPTPVEDLQLSRNQKASLLKINMLLYRDLEKNVLKWIEGRFGLEKTIISDLYHVSPYYKRVLDADKQEWIVDLGPYNKMICLPLEDLKCCGEFNFKVEGDYTDPLWCSVCGANLDLDVYPLSKSLMNEATKWSIKYGDWLEPPFLNQAVEMIKEYDQQGLELTKKIRKELTEVFEEERVLVAYVPTGWD